MALLFIIGLFFYFIPTLLAISKKQAGSVFMVNLFLGWSLIGWIIAFVWALRNEQPIVIQSKETISNELSNLIRLKDQGVLTEQEFQSAKSKILQ
jgi:hypothetical protein